MKISSQRTKWIRNIWSNQRETEQHLASNPWQLIDMNYWLLVTKILQFLMRLHLIFNPRVVV